MLGSVTVAWLRNQGPYTPASLFSLFFAFVSVADLFISWSSAEGCHCASNLQCFNGTTHHDPVLFLHDKILRNCALSFPCERGPTCGAGNRGDVPGPVKEEAVLPTGTA